MRDFTPQVETLEIADSDLDNVSGGVLGGAAGNLVGTLQSTLPVAEVSGIAAQATGVHPNQVTGLAGL